MQKIKIIAVGKLREQALTQLTGEYIKRLGKFCSIEVIEVADESGPARENGPEIQRRLLVEATRILDRLKSGAYIIALDMAGNAPDSVELSKKIGSLAGLYSEVVYIIGGSHGLHGDVLKRSDYILSLSHLTFPHQLTRLILLEQIYRSYKIINNETYHK